MPVDHYENFPVASWLLPKRLRRPVEAIYRFARSADDIADEGDAPAAERLAQLAAYHTELDHIERGDTPADPVFAPLAAAIRDYAIPLAPFRDLLSAFAQDVEKTRYAHFGEVMDYCRRSANPVGRLMLHLYGDHDPRHLAYSDAICSSLQLINFLQDIAVDYQKDRIYLPQDELAAAPRQRNTDRPGRHARHVAYDDAPDRAHPQAASGGAPLGRQLKGRIGLEMRMIIMGGETILRKLHANPWLCIHPSPGAHHSDWASHA